MDARLSSTSKLHTALPLGALDYVVRSAKASDAKQIALLSGQLGYPVSALDMARRIIAVRRRANQKLYVAEYRGTIVGWLEIFLPPSVLNWGKAEIGALVVDQRSRRSGVGTSLMKKAQEWAKRKGCPFIYLRSNIIRKEAHRFYKKSGYNIYKTQHIFRLFTSVA